MKRVLLGLVMVAALMVAAGCNGFQCKTEMAGIIDAAASQAIADRALVDAGAMDDAKATATLKTNSATFNTYATMKTVNVFEYLFGSKQILVNGEYAERLDRANVLAAETAVRAEKPDVAAGWRQLAVEKESGVLIYVKDAKDGKRSQ
jgi:hypothetical protein